VIPMLGLAVAIGAMVVRSNYLRLEQETRSADALQVMMDHLYQDQNLSLALRQIHDGDVAAAAQQLDVLLCDDIVRLNSDLEDADDHTRACVGDVFRRIGRVRPAISEPAASGVASGATVTQTSAQRILGLAMANEPRAQR
jgi:hypothetical protein